MKWWLLFCLIAFAGSARGGGVADLEAAFLYQFSLFTEFSPEPESLTIQVHDRPELLSALTSLAARKTRNGKPIRVVSGDETASAQVVFLAAPSDAALEALLKRYESCRCLLVTAREGFGRKGAVINLYNEGDRLRFEIHRATGEKHQLKMSSQLLRLARILE